MAEREDELFDVAVSDTVMMAHEDACRGQEEYFTCFINIANHIIQPQWLRNAVYADGTRIRRGGRRPGSHNIVDHFDKFGVWQENAPTNWWSCGTWGPFPRNTAVRVEVTILHQDTDPAGLATFRNRWVDENGELIFDDPIEWPDSELIAKMNDIVIPTSKLMFSDLPIDIDRYF